MAMSHVQLVLPLLASLFFVPALCGYVRFNNCKSDGPNYTNVFAVEVVPRGEQISIYLTGGALLNIDGGKTSVYVTLKSPNEDAVVLKSYPLCDVTTPSCNTEGQIKFGMALRLTLPDIKYAGGSREDILSVSLQQNDSEPPKVLMCVEFKLEISAVTLVSA